MAAPYNYTNMPGIDEGVLTTGMRKIAKRLLVVPGTEKTTRTGATTVGRGEWLNVESLTWKTFMIYRADQAAGDIVDAQVDIEGAMELDAADSHVNTKFAVLGTIDATSRSLSIEAPWQYIRARLKTVEAANAEVHVGLYALGA